MNSGSWKLECTKDLTISYMKFEKGEQYDVKDKFPGDDGTLATGDWEVKTGKGGLINISSKLRSNHFKEL